MERNVEAGQLVYVRPTGMASQEFREKIIQAGLDRRAAQVLERSEIGVCTLILPTGVSVPGHSHPLPEDSRFAGHEYLELHEEHLTMVV